MVPGPERLSTELDSAEATVSGELAGARAAAGGGHGCCRSDRRRRGELLPERLLAENVSAAGPTAREEGCYRGGRRRRTLARGGGERKRDAWRVRGGGGKGCTREEECGAKKESGGRTGATSHARERVANEKGKALEYGFDVAAVGARVEAAAPHFLDFPYSMIEERTTSRTPVPPPLPNPQPPSHRHRHHHNHSHRRRRRRCRYSPPTRG